MFSVFGGGRLSIRLPFVLDTVASTMGLMQSVRVPLFWGTLIDVVPLMAVGLAEKYCRIRWDTKAPSGS